MDNIEQELIKEWCLDFNNVQVILELGDYNYNNGFYYKAYAHYLRALEITDSKEVEYYCLILIAQIYLNSGRRWKSVKQYLNFAISLFPNRALPYIMMARTIREELYYHNTLYGFDWSLVYSQSKIAESLYNENEFMLGYDMDSLHTYIIDSLKRLAKNEELMEYLEKYDFSNSSEECLNEVNNGYFSLNQNSKYQSYFNYNIDKLRYKFKGVERISRNYSEVMQDMFVLSVLDGKEYGTYIEVGAALPDRGNNTKILEENFGWSGFSLEYDTDLVMLFNRNRKNPCLCHDALTFNWFEDTYNYVQPDEEGFIDYLQIDLEPAESTLQCLFNIPFDKFKFRVITFEHDFCKNQNEYIRQSARDYLYKNGYIMLIPDICCNYGQPFEDWFVHRSVLIDEDNPLFNPYINKYIWEGNGNVNKIFYKQQDEE